MKTHRASRALRVEDALRATFREHRWSLALMFAATVLIAAQSVHGATVFAHAPVPLSGTRTINSNALAHSDGSDQDVATFDNFVLDKGAAVTGIFWRGAASTPAQLGFTVTIYPSKPDPAAQADRNNPLVVLNIAGNPAEQKLGSTLADYRATFDSAVMLDAGVQYWISIVSKRKDLSPWGWAEGSGGDGKSIQAYTEFKVLPAPGDRNFTLDDGR